MHCSNYRDLALLTGWIENQRAFEKHKQMLDNIYRKLNKKSADEFGINDNKSFDLIQTKIKNNCERNKFLQKGNNMFHAEKLFTTDKDNQRLKDRISDIRNRKNILLNHEEVFKFKNSCLKTRTNLLKGIETEILKKENEDLGRRILNK